MHSSPKWVQQWQHLGMQALVWRGPLFRILRNQVTSHINSGRQESKSQRRVGPDSRDCVAAAEAEQHTSPEILLLTALLNISAHELHWYFQPGLQRLKEIERHTSRLVLKIWSQWVYRENPELISAVAKKGKVGAEFWSKTQDINIKHCCPLLKATPPATKVLVENAKLLWSD